MSTSRVILKPRRAQPFFGRHPWVFAGAIASIDGNPADGEATVGCGAPAVIGPSAAEEPAGAAARSTLGWMPPSNAVFCSVGAVGWLAATSLTAESPGAGACEGAPDAAALGSAAVLRNSSAKAVPTASTAATTMSLLRRCTFSLADRRAA